MRKITKILLHLKSGKSFALKEGDEEFHTQYGAIGSKELKSDKDKLKSNTGEEFIIFKPTFPDLWENLERLPQIILQKDIGLILAKTGVNKESLVVDAGGGSGSLCLSLANVCKHVYAYETKKEHFETIQKNMQLFNLKNVLLHQKNVYEGIEEKEIDLITLDLNEPWQVLPQAEKALKTGGHLVVYLPNILQVKEFVDKAKKTSIIVKEVSELMQRKLLLGYFFF